MSSSFLKKFGPIILAIIIIGGAFLGGVYWGSQQTLALTEATSGLTNKTTSQPASVDFSEFWQAWTILNEKYAATEKHPSISDQDKVYGAIKGLAESFGDPYTTFFPPVEEKQFETQISGNFEGIGAEIGVKDGVLTVIAPLKGSPSEKAGLKAGDAILKVNATSTADLSPDTAISFIRGKKGTEVVLTVFTQGDKQSREVKIIRDVINIPTINTEARKDGVFVISLYSFSANSANLFRNALEQFVKSGQNKLILDLRGNPGGYLDASVDMASWFLPSDAVIVKEESSNKEKDIVLYSKGYNIFNKNLQMVVLVDGGSASASEILAGALQEQGVAKLVGQKTFGKGSVQELIPLNSETSLKITVARWLTPNGRSISDQGLQPDVVVPFTQADLEAKRDPQLEAAVKLLLEPKN